MGESEAGRKPTAIVIGCSDPRLADVASVINEQFKRMLGVEWIVPLPRPGVVGLYTGRTTSRSIEMRREALELEICIHLRAHQPRAVVIASHHDCLGHAGSDEEQELDARIAARGLESRLKRHLGFRGLVQAAIIERHPNPGWAVKMLD